MTADAPGDARRRLARVVEVDGTAIRWNQRGSGAHALVLVHGHRGHHVWWDAVVPLLEERWRLILVDLSGHGDSGHREAYDGPTWVREVRGVAEAAGVDQDFALVGHSMGGRIALAAAIAEPDGIRGVLTLDSVFLPGAPPVVFERNPTRRPRYSATREEALARFRLEPPQPDPPAALLRRLAEYSVRESDDGWAFAHDPRGIPALTRDEVEGAIGSLTVPWLYAYAEQSALPTASPVAWIRERAGTQSVETVSLPGHHHVILDHPEESAHLVDRWASALWSQTPRDRR